MKTLISTTLLLFLATVILASCSSSVPTPVMSPTHTVETATSIVTAFPETNTPLPAIPVYTPTSTTPSPTPVLPTEVSKSIPGGMVYYYFVDLTTYAPPGGSVVIMPDNLILAPTQLDSVYGSDVAADLRSALEAVLKDGRNYWSSDKLQIDQVTYNAGHVNVVLQGEYYAVAPVVLTAARAQILMTLFANPTLQSATVTINRDTIANIAISHSIDAQPANYVYTRTEIETFMAEHAHTTP